MLIVAGFGLLVLCHYILLHLVGLWVLIQFFLLVLNTMISLFSALAAATMHISPNSVSYILSFFMCSQSACVVCAGINGSFFYFVHLFVLYLGSFFLVVYGFLWFFFLCIVYIVCCISELPTDNCHLHCSSGLVLHSGRF